jgi:4-hydroxythreonine-4-phosphate dehydrogenase
MQRKTSAMVTAPVSKEGLAMAGYGFPGQTEMVALLSGSQRVAMMLLSPKMRIGLVTIHAPISSLRDLITREKVQEKVSIIYESLQKDFRILKPRIAVLALNPHAGENGLLGLEEQEIILPSLSSLRDAGMTIEGPFPADGFFGMHSYRSYDAIVAMYHDQGLIPLKMIGFDAGVNFSAGLPIVRTSPDHGTAFSIAGKNKASSKSMVEAIVTAVRISQNRQRA